MNILEKIFSYKKAELAHFKSQDSLKELQARVQDLDFSKGFEKALRDCSQKFAIIAEVKHRSPSKGVLRESFDPVAIALAYAKHGAACLSVLTDQHFFGGSLDYLRQIRAATDLPLLRKDFVWEDYQIYAAREAGADAVLLIAAMLEKNQLEDLQGLAKDLSLDVLVEVHDAAETEVATEMKASLIGVNNRDLRDFSVSLETSKKLFPLMEEGVLKVSESGLGSNEDLASLKVAGAGAFLIGETLVKQEDPGEALRSFLL